MYPTEHTGFGEDKKIWSENTQQNEKLKSPVNKKENNLNEKINNLISPVFKNKVDRKNRNLSKSSLKKSKERQNIKSVRTSTLQTSSSSSRSTLFGSEKSESLGSSDKKPTSESKSSISRSSTKNSPYARFDQERHVHSELHPAQRKDSNEEPTREASRSTSSPSGLNSSYTNSDQPINELENFTSSPPSESTNQSKNFTSSTLTTAPSYRYSGEEKQEPNLKQQSSPTKIKREYLMMKGISFDKSEFLFDDTIVNEKAQNLHKVMPKIQYQETLLMSAFIQKNKEVLRALAKELHPNGLYLRREVSGLALSLLITPEGQLIWETKTKAIHEKAMGDGFKKVHKCIDHDTLKFYISGTMSIDRSNEMKIKTAFRELNAGKAMKDLPNVAQVIHSMSYTAKDDLMKSEKVQILMEYYPKGDLQNIIQKFSLPNDKKEKITDSILNGVLAIHDKGWIHGDFKPGNIFFDNSLEPYIGDFGFTHPKSEIAGSGLIFYFHPQFYLVSEEDKFAMQERADMFALGLTLAQMELRLNKLPWDNQYINYLAAEIGRSNSPYLKSEFKKELTKELNKLYQEFPEDTPTQKLIKKLINPKITEIPTAAEAKAIWNSLLANNPNV